MGFLNVFDSYQKSLLIKNIWLGIAIIVSLLVIFGCFEIIQSEALSKF